MKSLDAGFDKAALAAWARNYSSTAVPTGAYGVPPTADVLGSGYDYRALSDAPVPAPVLPPKVKAIIEHPAYRAVSMASGVVGTYHGYKRNDSVFWALAWGVFGSFFPLAAMPIAVAQGIGKKKR
jgi:hypothetical protein